MSRNLTTIFKYSFKLGLLIRPNKLEKQKVQFSFYSNNKHVYYDVFIEGKYKVNDELRLGSSHSGIFYAEIKKTNVWIPTMTLSINRRRHLTNIVTIAFYFHILSWI